MLVLVADKYPAEGLTALHELGLEVESRPSLSAEELPAALAQTGATVLVVRSTKVTAAAFEQGKNLALVIRAGAGVNTIDLEAASQRGVFVTNCPGKNAIAVAELTMGFIMALDRNIPDAVALMRAGKWDKKRFSEARGLYGRKLALVGFGAIAREVFTRARAFGMEISTYDPFLSAADAEAAGVRLVDSIPKLVADADVVSVHVPYSRATHHLVDAAVLGAMKDGASLIHASRGGVVDDAALATAVKSGKLRAAVDVLEDEPAGGKEDFDNPLAKLDGVYATPHIGASTDEAQAAISVEVVRITRCYMEGTAVPNCVNVQTRKGPQTSVVVRHHDRVGVLAAVLEDLRSEGLNVQEMSNVIFAGNHAASATIIVNAAPSDALLARLDKHEHVLSVSTRTSA